VHTKQQKKFYRKIIHEVKYADNVFIFGPDNAKMELFQEMKVLRSFYPEVIGVEHGNLMTRGQMIARAKRAFFTSTEIVSK
jgi:hypothetical protein